MAPFKHRSHNSGGRGNGKTGRGKDGFRSEGKNDGGGSPYGKHSWDPGTVPDTTSTHEPYLSRGLQYSSNLDMSKTSLSLALGFQPQATSSGRSLQLPIHPALAEDSAPITTGTMSIATPSQSAEYHPFEPIQTPALVHTNHAQQIVGDAPAVPHGHPQQGQILPIDVGYQQSDDAVELLSVQTLDDLHHLDAASTIDLQQTLIAARHAHHVQLSVSEEQRSALLSTLGYACDSELVHDENIRRLNDNFVRELNASFKLSGEPRAMAQRAATMCLDKARDESQLARKERGIIETCRDKILSLDNKRIVAANAFANTVHALVTRALSGPARQTGPTNTKAHGETASKSTSISSDLEAGAQVQTENAGISEDNAELEDDPAAMQQAELEEDLAAKRHAELEQCPDIDRRSVNDAMAHIFHAKVDSVESLQDDSIAVISISATKAGDLSFKSVPGTSTKDSVVSLANVKKAASITISGTPATKDDRTKGKPKVVKHANEDNSKKSTMSKLQNASNKPVDSSQKRTKYKNKKNGGGSSKN
ncbi:hypothetical protein FB567DRAFT_224981 [Paraphoma chrysanthemicola]|uniref:Uncharacterized protein n=1 Tax=Paraphoma chrysanthemicola TaxID=798071 RepID=A0A8K0QSZ3_9PLEO|nr:hypothetical protein FB567DRAFT_224981 [Paraphoma chrysanthemicola]